MNGRSGKTSLQGSETPISPGANDETQHHPMYQDFKQDDGMHPAAFEHHNSAPQVTVPAHVSPRETLRLNVLRTNEGNGGEEVEHAISRRIKVQVVRFSRRYWIWIVAVLLILGLSLGLALGFTMNKDHSGTQAGSGIVGLDLGDGSPQITFFFQHRSGKVRQAQYLEGVWTGYRFGPP